MEKRALACNNCLKWYHVDCLRMNTNVYKAFVNTLLEWICCHCGFPNFSSSLFAETFAESFNSYGTLSSNNLHFTKDDEHDVVPKFASTPKVNQLNNDKWKGPYTSKYPSSIKRKRDTKFAKTYQNLCHQFSRHPELNGKSFKSYCLDWSWYNHWFRNMVKLIH